MFLSTAWNQHLSFSRFLHLLFHLRLPLHCIPLLLSTSLLLSTFSIFLQFTHSGRSTHALCTVQILTISKVIANGSSNYLHTYYHFSITLCPSSQLKLSTKIDTLLYFWNLLFWIQNLLSEICTVSSTFVLLVLWLQLYKELTLLATATQTSCESGIFNDLLNIGSGQVRVKQATEWSKLCQQAQWKRKADPFRVGSECVCVLCLECWCLPTKWPQSVIWVSMGMAVQWSVCYQWNFPNQCNS